MKQLTATILMIALGGCAVTPERVSQMDDKAICLTYHSTGRAYEEYKLLETEYFKRHGHNNCLPYLEQQAQEERRAKQAVGALLLGAAAVAVARNSRGSAPTYATGVAWDGFYDANRNYVWRCRNRVNGEFVHDSYCYGMPLIDSWPGN